MTTHTTPAATVESTPRAHFAHDFVWAAAGGVLSAQPARSELPRLRRIRHHTVFPPV